MPENLQAKKPRPKRGPLTCVDLIVRCKILVSKVDTKARVWPNMAQAKQLWVCPAPKRCKEKSSPVKNGLWESARAARALCARAPHIAVFRPTDRGVPVLPAAKEKLCHLALWGVA